MPARHFLRHERTAPGCAGLPRLRFRTGAEWHPTGYARAGFRCRAHVHDAAEHINAIAYVLQRTARLGASRIETATVVAHLETEPPVFDIAALKKQGVEKLFTPGTPLQDIVDWLRKRFPEEKR